MGLHVQRCPYPADSNEAWSWYSGFLEASRPLSSDFALTTASFRTVIMELPQDLVVWEEGYDAGLALGTAQPRCPYPAESNEAWSWHAGFIEGRAIPA